MDDPTGVIQRRRLAQGAQFRTLPLSVKCPANCAFCYESRVSEVLPHVHTEYLPPYDGERFDEFREQHSEVKRWEAETGNKPWFSILPTFERTERGVSHFPICDIFSAGLSHEQIEELVRIREGDTCLLYAVGLNIDPDFVGYLTRKYPETFRLHLSIVTFDREIRGRLMHPEIDVDALRRVCTLMRHGTYFLISFNAEQILSDTEELLASTSADHGGLFIHKLYYDRRSPQRVVNYAKMAEAQREAGIRGLARLPRDGRPFMCSLGADIQAYTRRFELYPLFENCSGKADEVVFCGGGARDVIADFFSEVPNRVVAMESAFGGNLDLVQGGTVRGVIEQIRALRGGGRSINRVVVPDAMFWIDEGFDLHGDRPEQICEAFPGLMVEVIPIPVEVIRSVVNIDDCSVFYDDPDRPAAGEGVG